MRLFPVCFFPVRFFLEPYSYAEWAEASSIPNLKMTIIVFFSTLSLKIIRNKVDFDTRSAVLTISWQFLNSYLRQDLKELEIILFY